MKRTTNGFSLIELMIVVVIVAVLAAIAWPLYQNYVVRANRTAAAACTTEAAQFMERFHTLNMRYDQDRGGAAVALPAMECATALASAYTISIAASATNTYTIRAAPQGVQATRDTDCGTLSVDSTGLRAVTGTLPTNKCW